MGTRRCWIAVSFIKSLISSWYKTEEPRCGYNHIIFMFTEIGSLILTLTPKLRFVIRFIMPQIFPWARYFCLCSWCRDLLTKCFMSHEMLTWSVEYCARGKWDGVCSMLTLWRLVKVEWYNWQRSMVGSKWVEPMPSYQQTSHWLDHPS